MWHKHGRYAALAYAYADRAGLPLLVHTEGVEDSAKGRANTTRLARTQAVHAVISIPNSLETPNLTIPSCAAACSSCGLAGDRPELAAKIAKLDGEQFTALVANRIMLLTSNRWATSITGL